jgi:hypothetical protein
LVEAVTVYEQSRTLQRFLPLLIIATASATTGGGAKQPNKLT